VSEPERLDAMLERIRNEPVPELTPEQRAAREEAERVWREQEAHLERLAREEWKRAAGIPRLHRGARFDGARPTPAVVGARRYLDAEEGYRTGRALVLLGPTGSGKTFAAAAALDQLAHVDPRVGYRPSAAFYHVGALIAELLDSHRRPATLDRAKETHLLVIDDYGASYVATDGLAACLLEEILMHRHAEILPTVLTSNLTAAELRTTFTDRVLDRLSEWATVISVAGPSLRRKAGG
jgi:DNA replication protein DnaC